MSLHCLCVCVCVRAQAIALPGHILARLQGCGRGGARNGDIYKICTYRLLFIHMLLTAFLFSITWGESASVGSSWGLLLLCFSFFLFLFNSKASSEVGVVQTQAD